MKPHNHSVDIIKNEKSFQFKIYNTKEEPIFSSINFSTLSQCQSAIDSVKINVKLDKRYDRLIENQKDYIFILKAGNGKKIGSSRIFKSTTEREETINQLKTINSQNTIFKKFIEN